MSKVFILTLKPDNEIEEMFDVTVVGVFDSYEKAEKAAKVMANTHKQISDECRKDMEENNGDNLEGILAKNNAGLLLSYNGIGIHETDLNTLDANFFPDEEAFNELSKSLE